MTGADIGQQLQQARRAQKLTIEQVARATHIRAHYLSALEAGDFDILPSNAQVRGFLRTYAGFLKLDPEAILAQFDLSQGTKPAPDVGADIVFRSAPSPGQAEARGQEFRSEQAEAIFLEIGADLRRQRELLGLTLEDVERHTHLRQHHLASLEAGDLDALPSPVQGRGMLDNYASFLGLNSEALLLRFAEGLQARLAVRKAVLEPTTRPIQRGPALPGPLQRLLSPDVLIGVTFLVFLAAFLLWGAIRIFSMRTVESASPTAPSIADVLLATETETTVPTPAPVTSTQAAVLPVFPLEGTTTSTLQVIIRPGSASGVQVYITVLQRAWMRAVVDGKVEFEGRVLPGSAYPFAGENEIEIITSNGAALRVFYNQQDQGQMGLYGQVVDRIFTNQGIVTPTATITRTPQPSPINTPTVILPVNPGSTASP